MRKTRIIFAIRDTPAGVVASKAIRRNGKAYRTVEKRFRNTCYVSGVRKARAWIKEELEVYAEMVRIEGIEQPEIVNTQDKSHPTELRL
jgi:hypothetical protein